MDHFKGLIKALLYKEEKITLSLRRILTLETKMKQAIPSAIFSTALVPLSSPLNRFVRGAISCTYL
jgi:hypothetical protein